MLRPRGKSSLSDLTVGEELVDMLREHRKAALAAGLYRPEAFVICTGKGTPLSYRNVARRGLDKAVDAAGLNPPGVQKLSLHDLRSTYASHLIRTGIDPVRAAKRLGHSRASVTLDVYAKDFEAARKDDDEGERLSAAFAGVL